MLYRPKHLHLELSSLCNARCPFCPRNFYGVPYNAGYEETNLTLDQFQQIFSKEFLSHIQGCLINGNFGDFVMNPQSVDIIRYMLSSNPKMEILVNTNGSARDREFWQDLGRLGVTIEFCIDGIGDTNRLYRQDTDFDTIIRNAREFIGAGGRAVWKMTKFHHNREQRTDIYNIAKYLKFDDVIMRDSVRTQGPVYNRHGKKVYVIGTAEDTHPETLDQDRISELTAMYDANQETTLPKKITCQAQKDQSIYVSADGHVYPCCWTGFNPRAYRSTPLSNAYSRWNRDLNRYIHHNDAREVGIESALEWFDNLSKAWDAPLQPEVCKHFCGDGS